MRVLATTLLLVGSVMATDLCPEPVIPNGRVSGRKSDNFFAGQVTCYTGYHLVGGSTNVKCRSGKWSGTIPACSVIGSCPELPMDLISKGRILPVRGSRNSAYKFKCSRDFTLLGERRTHCQGDNWSHKHTPVCAKPGCDESFMLDIPFGRAKPMLRGAAYKYKCSEGLEMEGSSLLYCDGDRWNGTVPLCLVAPEAPQLQLLDSQGTPSLAHQVGDVVRVECTATSGNPLPEVWISVTDDTLTSTPRPMGSSLTWTLGPEDHNKEISCSATNKAGVAFTTVTLAVLAKPESVVATGPSFVYPGEQNEYSCQVEGGNPGPSLDWEVTDQAGATLEFWSEGARMVVEPSFGQETDMNVVCRAVNSAGSVESFIKVGVAAGPTSTSISGPSLVFPGGWFEYNCQVNGGNPDPTIDWQVRDSWGSILEIETEGHRMVLNLDAEHQGGLDIDCRAENEVSSVASAFYADTAYLPSSLSVDVPEQAQPGDTITLSCSPNTTPGPRSAVQPDLEWRLEGLGADLVMAGEQGEAELRVSKENVGEEFVLLVECWATVEGVEGEVTSGVREVVVVSRMEETSTVLSPKMVRLLPEEMEQLEQDNEEASWSEDEDEDEYEYEDEDEYEYEDDEYNTDEYPEKTTTETMDETTSFPEETTTNMKEVTNMDFEQRTEELYEEETTTENKEKTITMTAQPKEDAVMNESGISDENMDAAMEEPGRSEPILENKALKQVGEKIENEVEVEETYMTISAATNLPILPSLALLFPCLLQLLR